MRNHICIWSTVTGCYGYHIGIHTCKFESDLRVTHNVSFFILITSNRSFLFVHNHTPVQVLIVTSNKDHTPRLPLLFRSMTRITSMLVKSALRLWRHERHVLQRLLH